MYSVYMTCTRRCVCDIAEIILAIGSSLSSFRLMGRDVIKAYAMRVVYGFGVSYRVEKNMVESSHYSAIDLYRFECAVTFRGR